MILLLGTGSDEVVYQYVILISKQPIKTTHDSGNFIRSSDKMLLLSDTNSIFKHAKEMWISN